MKWTNANVGQLIELYREHEVLWNTTLIDFKNRNKKHDAWTTIAKYFQTDKDMVEKKMRSLIGQLQRDLTFLKDKHKSRLPQEAEIKTQTIDPSDSMVEINLTHQLDQIQKDSNISLEIQSNIDFDGPKELFKCPQKTPNHKTKSFKTDNKDKFDIFGQHVACKIRKLSTSYAKSTIQYHINNIIFQAELGQYDQPPQTQFKTYQTPYFDYQPSSSLLVSESSSSRPSTPITFILQQPWEDYETKDEA
ncbi:uncharacterized protein LOC112683876 [Sipha flava]|uniref:Uncharacterized protein LOC112683876 n=1 Tax=Sipha flava TaxID=143950 RepID=A0A8B8FKI4_9HEMI|nr:uncharacterized protein LOC112683876 [Sipha flava]